MQVDAILCNHAEAVNNLLYLAGGGVEIGFIPPGVSPPYVVNVGIGLMITVPWVQTNQQHRVEIELMSEDGQPVVVPRGPGTGAPVQAQIAFNVGRPAGLDTGDDQHVCLAANLPGLPLPAFGKYEFIVRLDGHDERRLAYRIKPVPGAQMAVGTVGPPGPGQLPR